MNNSLKQKIVEALVGDSPDATYPNDPLDTPYFDGADSITNRRPVTDNPIQPPGPPNKPTMNIPRPLDLRNNPRRHEYYDPYVKPLPTMFDSN
jgi:hypothetical protein